MFSLKPIQSGLLVVGAFALATAGASSAFAQAGFSPIDKSNPAASKQDTNLKPHATPPTVTPADKLPVDKLKLSTLR